MSSRTTDKGWTTDKCYCFDRRWPQRPAVLREVSEVLHSERVAGV